MPRVNQLGLPIQQELITLFTSQLTVDELHIAVAPRSTLV